MGVIIGYLLGGIPFAYWLGRQRGIDIRETGSGNPGAMNMLRVLGWGPALLVLLLDMGKGALAVGLASYLQVSPYSAMAAVVLGHVYPLWLGGRGGKGLAAALGAVLYLQLWWAIAAFAVGWLPIYLWRRDSDPANLVGGLAVAGAALQFTTPEARLWVVLMALIIMMRHWQEVFPRKGS